MAAKIQTRCAIRPGPFIGNRIVLAIDQPSAIVNPLAESGVTLQGGRSSRAVLALQLPPTRDFGDPLAIAVDLLFFSIFELGCLGSLLTPMEHCRMR
jgi:hypothetical protein